MPSAWSGAVLTGGAGRRMGRDKAAIEVGGQAMADRVADALRAAGAAAVVRVGGPTGDVADEVPGAGPLAGVLAALRWTGEEVVVVAPCDLVAPSPATFASLVAALRGAPRAVAAVPGRDRPLPLALRAAAAPVLAAAFAGGERSLHRAVATVPTVVVDLDDAGLADADTPSELPPGAR